ncbi:MAG: MarR family winged helix-turn-helix transcriptional regulator [Ktedonobacteraceae bacterium]
MKEIHVTVTPRQREILTLLSQRQQWTIGEIASLLGVSSAAASKCVDRLERKKLVKRQIDEWDRRNVLVSLTAISHSLLNES